jgi:hypothetical protein
VRADNPHLRRSKPATRLFWDGVRSAPPGWRGLEDRGPEELVREGIPLPTGAIDQVYVGPAVGRVPHWDLVELLEEFRRVLVVGGTIRVAAYDMEATLAAYDGARDDFFWEHWVDAPAGALGAQLLESGAVRTLLAPDLVAELLRRAGFDDAAVRPFGISAADPKLAGPDRLGEHCCFVEAHNALPWPDTGERGRPSAPHLALADSDGRSYRIIWTGPARSRGTARFRPVGSPVWREASVASWPGVDGDAGDHVFAATCAELDGGVRYEYEIVHTVEGRPELVEASSFETAPTGEDEAVRFAFIADTGISGRADGLSDATGRVVEEVARLGPHVVLGGGDYAYRSGDRRWRSGQQAVQAWLREMAPLTRRHPFMPQYGNHEVELAERYRDWAVHFPPPEGGAVPGTRSYSFDVGPCHLAAFYAPGDQVDPAEVGWLWQDLAEARRRERPWLIVFQHQPLLAHGTSHPSSPGVARALAGALTEHRVDLHLSAHDQSYERTHPLVWDGTVPRPVRHQGPRYPKGEGTVLAKVSPAGKRSDRGGGFSSLPSELPEVVACADDQGHHFAIIEADATSLRLDVYRVRAADDPLELVDRMRILA